MIGPTGVGKTEIARRLARLADAPFVKVEATKFTEVGYVGKDVDSIVRDLVDVAVKQERERADDGASARRPRTPPRTASSTCWCRRRARASASTAAPPADNTARQVMRKRLREGALADKEIEIDLADAKPALEIMGPQGMEEMAEQLKGLFSQMGAGQAQDAQAEDRRGAAAADRRRGGQAGQRGRDPHRRAGQCRGQRHRLPRRDRQGRHAQRHQRRRCQPPGRAARPAAAGRGHHGQHQVRHGQDRPHPVHRLRRLPPGQAERPDPRTAGPLPDPRRAAVRCRWTTSRPSSTSTQASLVKQYQALLATEGVTLDFRPRRRSAAWRRSRSTSTSAPRTSARAAWPR